MKIIHGRENNKGAKRTKKKNLNKKRFDDFIKSHPTCSVVKNSTAARNIYENIIWKEEIRIKMTEVSELQIPALYVCAVAIEEFCSADSECDLDISNNTVKQVIGRMIGFSLEPLGYKALKKGRLPQSAGSTVFKNATIFSKSAYASEIIIKKIVAV